MKHGFEYWTKGEINIGKYKLNNYQSAFMVKWIKVPEAKCLRVPTLTAGHQRLRQHETLQRLSHFNLIVPEQGLEWPWMTNKKASEQKKFFFCQSGCLSPDWAPSFNLSLSITGTFSFECTGLCDTVPHWDLFTCHCQWLDWWESWRLGDNSAPGQTDGTIVRFGPALMTFHKRITTDPPWPFVPFWAECAFSH